MARWRPQGLAPVIVVVVVVVVVNVVVVVAVEVFLLGVDLRMADTALFLSTRFTAKGDSPQQRS